MAETVFSTGALNVNPRVDLVNAPPGCRECRCSRSHVRPPPAIRSRPAHAVPSTPPSPLATIIHTMYAAYLIVEPWQGPPLLRRCRLATKMPQLEPCPAHQPPHTSANNAGTNRLQ